MIGIHDLRRQNRQDLVLKILLHILLLILLQFLEVQSAYTIRAQLLLNIRISLIPLLIKRRNRLEYLIELLLGRHTGTAVLPVRIRMRHIEQAAHTDHKKLIQIAAEDRNEFHTLQKRHRCILCLLQYPLVESQPR